ncbi:glycosyl hydrolase family 61-domain-containing protein [Elsinoe ampelina]|uniref:Glycosyl hydrolase family 61-domain-containing protein n=1 Tax=Elsinoe ampelina TaxID=302913 RepID=A0A6A6G7A0_9PEZI|nr:glycosyl hydrolase family 61-domain-containing protein [Elsinoe ampelina]
MSILAYAALLSAAASTAYGHGMVQYVKTGSAEKTLSFDLSLTYNLETNRAKLNSLPGWLEWSQDNGFIAPDSKPSGGQYAGIADPQNFVCGSKAAPGGVDFPVAAGGNLDFIWSTWPDSHIGPVITYLAKCPGTTCAGVDKTTLKFFKIEEAGLTMDGTTQNWASKKVNSANGFTWTTPIPKELPDGAYVARHEIIALHGAGSANGAQLYPNCVNLKISGGSGTMSTDGVDASTMYSPTDPGLLVPNIYGGITSYTIPGPPLRSGSGGSSPAPSSASSAAPSSAAPSSAAPSASSAAPPASSAAPVPTTTAAPAPSGPVVTATSIATTVIPVTTTGGASPAPTGGSGSGGSTKPLPEGTTLADLLAWLKIILNRTSPAKRSEFFSHMLM